MEAPPRCSALAERLEEPMIGSVDERRRWLLIEDRSAWGSHAVEDLFGAEAVATAKARGLRVLLVRRREGDPAEDASRCAILVDTVTREMASRRVTDLDGLSLDAAASDPIGDFGARHSEAIFLVCTNGKRDACCALRGRALMGTLADEHGASLWECTHLGGHRFAGNLVCLPDGIVYGRVPPTDGPRLADAYLRGEIDPGALRGRSAWPAPAQVAEQVVRLRTGLTGIDDVMLASIDVAGDRASVTVSTRDGTSHQLELRAEAADPSRPISCGAAEPESPMHWFVAEGY